MQVISFRRKQRLALRLQLAYISLYAAYEPRGCAVYPSKAGPEFGQLLSLSPCGDALETGLISLYAVILAYGVGDALDLYLPRKFVLFSAALDAERVLRHAVYAVAHHLYFAQTVAGRFC